MVRRRLRQFTRDEQGTTAIEYVLVAGLVSIMIISALLVIAPVLSNTFNTAGNRINTP